MAACSRAEPPSPSVAPSPPSSPAPSPEPAPAVELVVADLDDAAESPHTRVRFAKTTPAGVVVTRTVSVPGIVTTLAWVGPDPVVMLDDGAVGRIPAAGFAPLPPVPAPLWKTPKPKGTGDSSAPTDRFDAPRWRVMADAAGAVWQARCDWGWDLPHGIAHHCVPEGGRCDAWVFARVWPGPTTVSLKAPAAAFDSDVTQRPSPPPATPAPGIHAEIAHVVVPDGPTGRAVLRCTEAGATIQYPTDDDRDMRDNDGDGVSELTWLSTKPPLLSVTRRVGCLETESVIFEGCKKSETYGGTVALGGPHDVLVLAQNGDKLQLRWHDRDLGSLDHVAQYAFAPPPPRAADR